MLKKTILSVALFIGLAGGSAIEAEAQRFGGILGGMLNETEAATGAKSAAPVENCLLHYRRADSALGWTLLDGEQLALKATEAKTFATDWRYEKRRNDGSNYYGSHTREVRNGGQRVLKITYKIDPVRVDTRYLDPGASTPLHGDIVEVACP